MLSTAEKTRQMQNAIPSLSSPSDMAFETEIPPKGNQGGWEYMRGSAFDFKNGTKVQKYEGNFQRYFDCSYSLGRLMCIPQPQILHMPQKTSLLPRKVKSGGTLILGLLEQETGTEQ